MKKFLLSIFTVVTLTASAQAPNFEFVNEFTSDNSINTSLVRTDASGNSYHYGSFLGTADLDPGVGVLNETSISPTDPRIFLQKQSSSGTILWTILDVLPSEDIQIDDNGNIYLVGTVGPTTDADPGVGVSNITATGSTGYVDAFVCKLNSSGTFQWANVFGLAAENEYARAICIDNSSNVIVGIEASNTSSFKYGMILKITPSGTLTWQKNLSGPGRLEPRSIDSDAAGNVYVGGRYLSTIDFDPGTGTQNLSTMGSSEWNKYVVKLTSTGAFSWVNEVVGASNNLSGSKLVVDDAGNVYQTGWLRSLTFDFDSGTGTDELTAPTTASSGYTFVHKINANGTHAWVDFVSITYPNYIENIDLDAAENVLVSSGYEVKQFDPSGNVLFSIDYLDPSNGAEAYVVTISGSDDGSIYLGGSVSYDTEIETGNTNSAVIAGSAIVVKYSQCVLNNATTISGSTLSATQTSAIYQWIDCNNANAPIAGANSQTFTPTVSGSYAVILSNGSCADTSACQAVTISTSGIEEQTASNFNIYPNPAKDFVTLNNLTVGTTLQLTDMTGKTVLETSVSTEEMTIDLNGLTEGVYFVQILDNASIIGTKKLAISK